ncbi:uncharacterized protein LOC142328784 isoform X1 [Lycorma delicatula]|uniref:uncharacterized protein LOC142328784 isoform X1 n=1 Tax=Lycorma delicatula TaxID=130591 RepID=UPI003F510E2A
MATPAVQQFCLRWNNHQPNFISVFSSLLNSESLVDVTLAAEGKHIQAHKIVLSACSTYFQSLFTLNPCKHPIVILKDIKYSDLKTMVDFMYCGEVNVSQEQLPAVLKTAETLKVKGLAEMPEHNISLSSSLDKNSESSPAPSPSMLRRKRLRKSSTGSGSGSTEQTTTGGSEETVGSGAASPNPNSSLKMEPHSEAEGSLRNEPSTESEPGFASQESVDDEPTPTLQQSTSEERNDSGMKSSMEDSGTPSGSSHYSSGWGGSSQMQQQKQHHVTEQEQQTDNDCIIITPCRSLSQSSAHSQTSRCQSAEPHITITPTEGQVQFSSPSDSSRQSSPCHFPQSPSPSVRGRRRSNDPQHSENFRNALEAVRVGGLGFCKAARLFGVNNRTLWLEYKRLGYPVVRRSLKNMKSSNEDSGYEIVKPVTTKQSRLDLSQTTWTPTTTASSNIFDASFFFQNQFENYLPVIKSSTTSSAPSNVHSQQHDYHHHQHHQIKNYTNTGTIMLATNSGSNNLNVTDLSSPLSSNNSPHPSHQPHQPLPIHPPPPLPHPPPHMPSSNSQSGNLLPGNIIKYQ